MASTTEKPECAGYLMLREKDKWKDGSLHRAACHGDADWEVEAKHYCLMHAPLKEKAEKFERVLQDKLANKDYNFRGVWFPGDVDFRDYNFESEVNFNFAVFSGDAVFSEAKFSGGDSLFVKAQFSGGNAYFNEVQFSGGDAVFSEAKFSGGFASFDGAQFSSGDAVFSEAQFSGGNAYFNGAQFSGGDASFIDPQFSGGNAYFQGAQFSKIVFFYKTVFAKNLWFAKAVFEKQVFFDRAEFKTEAFADFGLARFMDFTRFMDLMIEEGAEFYFGEATFEKPERVHFHSIPNLQPRWFINVDTRKFYFENVDFPLLKRRPVVEIYKQKPAAEKELEKTQYLLLRNRRPGTHKELSKLLITAYRRLAENAEENNRYEEAMGFRYLAMETHRRADWWRRWPPLTLHWWYWASSGYGERAWRAAAMLLLVWLIPFLFYLSPAAVFTRVETKRDEEVRGAAEYHVSTDVPGMPASEAVLYSLNTMAFQKPEPKAAKTSSLTQWIVFAQTILGPLQAALLALAIRRKFMR